MTVGIVGLGLIGGAVGQALASSGFVKRVVGFDRSPEAGQEALRLGCVRDIVERLEDMRDANLLLVAVPPSEVPGVLRELSDIVKPGAVVTDCASVKSAIVAGVPEALETRFVGGHPIAGYAGRGAKYASPDLFDEAIWVLTPTTGTNPDALLTVEELVRDLGAIPVTMTPEEHDRHAAVLSHLPHLLASALILQSEFLTFPNMASGSWRDLTRVAGASPSLYADIFVQNSPVLLSAIETMRDQLEAFALAIGNGDKQALERMQEAAYKLKHDREREWI